MGFIIQNYTLMCIPLQNVYVTIKGRFSVHNNSFLYGMPNRYQIYSDYWFSLGKNMPTIQSSSVMINTDILPQDLYKTIYEGIKAQLDPCYGSEQQVSSSDAPRLTFVDD